MMYLHLTASERVRFFIQYIVKIYSQLTVCSLEILNWLSAEFDADGLWVKSFGRNLDSCFMRLLSDEIPE